jgi:hypothetical protein
MPKIPQQYYHGNGYNNGHSLLFSHMAQNLLKANGHQPNKQASKLPALDYYTNRFFKQKFTP